MSDNLFTKVTSPSAGHARGRLAELKRLRKQKLMTPELYAYEADIIKLQARLLAGYKNIPETQPSESKLKTMFNRLIPHLSKMDGYERNFFDSNRNKRILTDNQYKFLIRLLDQYPPEPSVKLPTYSLRAKGRLLVVEKDGNKLTLINGGASLKLAPNFRENGPYKLRLELFEMGYFDPLTGDMLLARIPIRSLSTFAAAILGSNGYSHAHFKDENGKKDCDELRARPAPKKRKSAEARAS